MTLLELSRDRFANRGKDRGATVVRFRLSRAARLVLVVRGPGPSCATVARIAYRGRVGANRIRFNGRIDRRPLEPGTYLLTPRLRGRTTDLGRAYVTIVSPGARPAAPILPVCKEAGPSRSFLGGEEGTVSPWQPTGPIQTGATLASAAAAPASLSASEGILGMGIPALSAPPAWSTFADATPLPSIVDIFLLALLCGSVVGTVCAAVYRLRSPQT